MNDQQVGKKVSEAYRAVHDEQAPTFAAAWYAAEMRFSSERRRYAAFGGIAAVLAIAATVLLSLNEARIEDEFLIADSLLNRTTWTAPSDVLLPRHQYDIYREVPFQVEPTNFNEGSLL